MGFRGGKCAESDFHSNGVSLEGNFDTVEKQVHQSCWVDVVESVSGIRWSGYRDEVV